jgi:drug/metabolite transporter (DMT)-like permease
MLKSSTPIMLLLLSFLVGREPPSIMLFSIVLLISSGVFLSSIGELQFNTFGFVLQLLAVISDALRTTLLDLLLSSKAKRVDSLSVLYYIAPPCGLLVSLGFVYFELNNLINYFYSTPLTLQFALLIFLNGALAFSLNISVILLVGGSSALLMGVCGPAKDILVVVLSVIVFGNPVTVVQVAGFSVSLFGLYLYKEFKSYFLHYGGKNHMDELEGGSLDPEIDSNNSNKELLVITRENMGEEVVEEDDSSAPLLPNIVVVL